jgi:hypothetical protein
LPDISKINALAIGSVAKVDGLAKASILDIDGVAVPSGFTGLLDETYASGATGAYSVRRLANSVTVLLRVRRETAGGAGDDDEADVAYDSNNELSLDSAISNASLGVTATTLGQFLNVGTVGGTTYTNADSLTGTAEGRVTQWKDQSGNSKDVSNTSTTVQPIIHEGTVNTDLVKENGKAAMILAKVADIASQGRYLYTVESGTTTTVNLSSLFSVATQESGTAQAAVSTLIATANPTLPAVNNDFSSFFIGGSVGAVTGAGMRVGDDEATAPGTLALLGTTDDANQHLFEWHVDRATSELIVDGTSEDTSTNPVAFSWTHIGLRALSSASVRLEGTVQELISFGADKYANRGDIQTNINGHFQIYP